jgi:ubiquinone biosynthesis protein COQ9
MDWNAVADDPDRQKLARTLVDLTPRTGWSQNALNQASAQAFGDTQAWKAIFPGGSRDAIWHISLVSDASMRGAFPRPASSMSAVIDERLAQNADLKPFVRRVMFFDMLHPFQALARMQRTAAAMFDCSPSGSHSAAARVALNISYTAIVCLWLFDRSDGGARTARFTRTVLRSIGLS